MKEKLKAINKILKKEYYIREIVTISIMIVALLGFVIYESFSIFTGTVQKTYVATIIAGPTNIEVTSEDSSFDSSTGQITIPAKTEKIIILDVTNKTYIPARYKLYYKPVSPSSLPSGVTIGVSNLSPYTSSETLTEEGVFASTKTVRVLIKNTSSQNVTIKLGAQGGYSNDSTITLSSGNVALSTITETMSYVDYKFTGSYQTFTAPAAGKYKLEVWGAEGGYRSDQSKSGKGGYSKGTVTLSKGQKIYIYVGGQGNETSKGWNGGGTAGYENVYGGGATDIRYNANTDPLNATSLKQRIIVAGGGGSVGASSKKGGYGGGTTGETTTDSYTGQGCSSTICGQGGTQSAGGTGTTTAGYTTTAGAFGKGGDGFALSSGYGGAGGGGWFGGSGSVPDGGGDDDRGGGGGSGYVLTSSSTKPSGYSPSSSYYLTKAETIGGNTSFTSPTGNNETGHTGDGYARITKVYEDPSGANEPVLASGMIPVVYNESSGTWEVADTHSEWYSYGEQRWANAVTVSDASLRNAKVGTSISMDKINTMWVWIPRYKYKIPSNIGSSSNVTSPPQIDVVFESETNTTGSTLSSCPIDSTTCYYTHPAFRNGASVYTSTAYDQGGWSKELTGIWVGKFETGGSETTPLIKPDIQYLKNQNVSAQFQTSLKFAGGTMNTSSGAVTFSGNTTYGLTSSTDTHMAKNTEWGAVAYLSQSRYGKMGNSNYEGVQKEIYINNSSSYYTGRSGGNVGGNTSIKDLWATAETDSQYNSLGYYSYNDWLLLFYNLTYNPGDSGIKVSGKGVGASTTGTIYGIYDMSGGGYEYTMANWNGYSGYTSSTNSGFTGPNSWDGSTTSGISFPVQKYYDKYTIGTSSSIITKEKAIKGDATYETMKWYSDNASFVIVKSPWATRGGYNRNTSDAGIFNYNNNYGDGKGNPYTFRSILIP